MKRLILILLSVAALALTGCSASSAPAAYRSVSPGEAQAMMEKETDYILLDVRTLGEFAEKHIPGAILIPNETIGSQPPEQLRRKDQLILVYCRSGNRSKQAAQKLAGMGYTRIVEIGGINQWPGQTVTGAP